MARPQVEPVPDEPVATATIDGERTLIVADYHAGIEVSLRWEGVEIDSHATDRREHLLELVTRTGADQVVFLGDMVTAIGHAEREEQAEIEALLDALRPAVDIILVKGNHDAEIEDHIDVPVTPTEGVRLGDIGFAHGHTWPAPEVLRAKVVCVAHEHPVVRLEDDVGGRQIERAWLRGRLNPDGFLTTDRYDDVAAFTGDLVVFPAYNDLTGGTWINVDGQAFLSPFLPDGLTDGQAYLLDGTRLGAYRRI
ncbi:MAG: metallophosphoesterase [Halobacteriales archaeon]|nr:metallophosphoesterase [Halobacteriales archaeon]